MIDPPAPPQTPPRPAERVIRPWRVLRDIVLMYAVVLLGLFVLAKLATATSEPVSTAATLLLLGSGLVLPVAGFTLVGCFTRRHRWAHLSQVVIGLWLTCLINVVLGDPIWEWLLSFFVFAFLASMGGGIAGAICKEER